MDGNTPGGGETWGKSTADMGRTRAEAGRTEALANLPLGSGPLRCMWAALWLVGSTVARGQHGKGAQVMVSHGKGARRSTQAGV